MLSKEVDEKKRKFSEISRNKKIKNKFNWVGWGGVGVKKRSRDGVD